MTFVEKLKTFKARTDMFIAGGDLSHIVAFVLGMQIMDEEACLDSFKEWLVSKKHMEQSAFIWPDTVGRYLEHKGITPEKQIDEFFNLLFEYLDDEGFLSEDLGD